MTRPNQKFFLHQDRAEQKKRVRDQIEEELLIWSGHRESLFINHITSFEPEIKCHQNRHNDRQFHRLSTRATVVEKVPGIAIDGKNHDRYRTISAASAREH